MRMSRRMGLVGQKPTLQEFFESLDPNEMWRRSIDSSSTAELATNMASSEFPTAPEYRVIFFASGSSFVIGKYNSTEGTFKKYVELGSKTVSLSGTTLSASENVYAGAFFITYSSWPEDKADKFLSRLSVKALNTHYASSLTVTRLSTPNHVSDASKFYLTIFTRSGNNYSYFNASPCNDIFNPVRIAPPSSSVTTYIYDPGSSSYVAAATIDGSSSVTGRSGGFYRLSVN